MPDQIRKVAIGIKRMAVIIWCVTGIVGVCYLAQPESGTIETPIIITAMTLIAALGGVDVWKQNRLDRLGSP